MVVDYYKSLVTGMKSVANVKSLSPPAYRTDLSVHLLSYTLTGFLSVGCAGLMLLEQYAARRVHCVEDGAPATSEYCWHHGVFTRNSTGGDPDPPRVRQTWLLQLYMYFFVRAFFFMAPHLLWVLKYKNKIVALLQGTCDVINDLEGAWIQYAETAEDEIRKSKMAEAGLDPDSPNTDDIRRKMAAHYTTTVSLAKNVQEMTQCRMRDYHTLLRFTGVRMAYDVVIHTAFLIVDISLLAECCSYDGTDFYCVTPWNNKTLRCMLPMLQILQQVMLLNVICCGFVWVVIFFHHIWLATYLLGNNTTSCLLEQIPFTENTTWECAIDRRTYKLMSLYLLQNFVILHPLDLLKTFVVMLERKDLAGERFVTRVRQEFRAASEGSEMRNRKFNPMLSLYDAVDDGETVCLREAAVS